MENQQYIVGIDGGGTKCKAVIAHCAKLPSEKITVLGTGVAGGANIFPDTAQAKENIVAATKQALANAGLEAIALSQLTVCAGLAGANVLSACQSMQQWQHPFKAFYLTHDLVIACLGAHQDNDGVVIVSGTGSCGFRFHNGESFTMGGHGFPHGDKASGAWLGFKATQHTLLAFDTLEPQGSLFDLIKGYFQIDKADQFVEKITGQPPAFYGQLAPLVFQAAEQGDNTAKQFIAQAAAYIDQLAKSLTCDTELSVAFVGGVSEKLKPHLSRQTLAMLVSPAEPPEIGAILFALQQLAAQ